MMEKAREPVFKELFGRAVHVQALGLDVEGRLLHVEPLEHGGGFDNIILETPNGLVLIRARRMIRRIDGSINKIRRVADKLAQDKNLREIVTLGQAVQNLLCVRARLVAEAEKSLESLAKSGGKNFSY